MHVSSSCVSIIFDPSRTQSNKMRASSILAILATVSAERFNRFFLIVFENTDLTQAMNQEYLKNLASQGRSYVNSHGVTHPSQPNCTHRSNLRYRHGRRLRLRNAHRRQHQYRTFFDCWFVGGQGTYMEGVRGELPGRKRDMLDRRGNQRFILRTQTQPIHVLR